MNTDTGTIILVLLVGISALTDLWQGRVYNAVTVPGLLLGLALSARRGGAVGILDVLCAAVFTVVVLFPFYSMKGLGAGDIKLLAAVSGFLPSEEYLLCFAGAFAIGAAYGAARLLWTRGRVHTVHFAVPVAASVLMHLTGIF